MTEASERIRAGDSVTRRGSDPPKVGEVIEIFSRSAEFRPDRPRVGEPGSVPDELAWVWWEGEPEPVPENVADLIKLTEGNDQQ